MFDDIRNEIRRFRNRKKLTRALKTGEGRILYPDNAFLKYRPFLLLEEIVPYYVEEGTSMYRLIDSDGDICLWPAYFFKEDKVTVAGLKVTW